MAKCIIIIIAILEVFFDRRKENNSDRKNEKNSDRKKSLTAESNREKIVYSEEIQKEFLTLREYDFHYFFDIMKEHFMNRETKVIFEKNVDNKKLFKIYENGVIEIIEASSTIRRVNYFIQY